MLCIIVSATPVAESSERCNAPTIYMLHTSPENMSPSRNLFHTSAKLNYSCLTFTIFGSIKTVDCGAI